ncbi:hypothetical protein [Modestobacter marinus]|uniref:hypothetical protein n=1 Tax=Modestobacter marinus TaxID=477641 RepID=UPI001C964EDB|nr:hypothetical protein [Modestobacter marinus]
MLLRPLRIVSLIRVARVLDRWLTRSLHGRVATYVTFTALLVVFMASLAVYDAERGAPDASIVDYDDDDAAAEAELGEEVRALAAEVRALRQELGAARGRVTPAG